MAATSRSRPEDVARWMATLAVTKPLRSRPWAAPTRGSKSSPDAAQRNPGCCRGNTVVSGVPVGAAHGRDLSIAPRGCGALDGNARGGQTPAVAGMARSYARQQR